MNTFVGFGRRNLNFANHWEDMDLNSYNSNNAVLLCFGGSQTIDQSKATRFCGTAERFIGLKLGNEQSSYKYVDLLGFYYTPKYEGCIEGQFSSEQRQAIAENIFIKRCFDENGKLNTIEKVIKSFSLINVLSHCWGAVETSYIGNIVEKNMLALGFTSDEIQTAFNQITHVSYAPYTDHSPFPCMKIHSFQDGTFENLEQQYIKAYGKKLNGVDIKYDPPQSLRKQFYYFSKVPVISVYTSQLINTADNSDPNALWDEHFIGMLERNPDWTPGHQQLGAKNADVVSKIASYALADAVSVSIRNTFEPELLPKTNMQELYQTSNTFLQDYSEEELKTSF